MVERRGKYAPKTFVKLQKYQDGNWRLYNNGDTAGLTPQEAEEFKELKAERSSIRKKINKYKSEATSEIVGKVPMAIISKSQSQELAKAENRKVEISRDSMQSYTSSYAQALGIKQPRVILISEDEAVKYGVEKSSTSTYKPENNTIVIITNNIKEQASVDGSSEEQEIKSSISNALMYDYVKRKDPDLIKDDDAKKSKVFIKDLTAYQAQHKDSPVFYYSKGFSTHEDGAMTEDEVKSLVDYKVYGTYKGEKPRDYTFTKRTEKMFVHGRKLYDRYKSVDDRHKELQSKTNRDFTRMQDLIRNASNKHNSTVLIEKEHVPISAIQGRDYQGNSVVPEFDVDSGRYRYVKPIAYYEISGKTIKSFNTEITVEIALSTRRKYTVYKERIIGSRPKERIKFEHVGNDFVTHSRINELFNNAEKKTGERVIFLNNSPFKEDMFEKRGALWYLKPEYLVELNATEVEGFISVRYAYEYSSRKRLLEAREYSGPLIQGRPGVIYGEIFANVTVDEKLGLTNKSVRVQIKSIRALATLRKLKEYATTGGRNDGIAFVGVKQGQGGNFIPAWSMPEQDAKSKEVIIDLDDGRLFDSTELGQFEVKDEFLIILFKDGKWVVTFKTPSINIEAGIGELNTETP